MDHDISIRSRTTFSEGRLVSSEFLDYVRRSEDELRVAQLASDLYRAREGDTGLGFGHRLLERKDFVDTFLAAKKDKNMGECFDLALSPEFLGEVALVELGLTTKPGVDGEIDGLRSEYDDLKRWLFQHGLTEGEIPRAQSGRTLRVITPKPEHSQDSVAIVRIRPLLVGAIPVEHDDEARSVKFGISKRMLFMLPTQLYADVAHQSIDDEGRPDASLREESSIDKIEQMLSSKKIRGIQPIQTGYYLALHPQQGVS